MSTLGKHVKYDYQQDKKRSAFVKSHIIITDKKRKTDK